MRILDSKLMSLGFVIMGLIGLSTHGLGDTSNTQVMAQGMNMSGSAGGGENVTGIAVVRDSVAVPLEGLTLPGGQFIHLYDSTPYKIMNGHAAVNVPCADNSTASIQVLAGVAPNLTAAELENLPELSTPGTMCLYHVDIPPPDRAVTDVALINPGESEIDFPPGSSAVVGVNEIAPGAEEHE